MIYGAAASRRPEPATGAARQLVNFSCLPSDNLVVVVVVWCCRPALAAGRGCDWAANGADLRQEQQVVAGAVVAGAVAGAAAIGQMGRHLRRWIISSRAIDKQVEHLGADVRMLARDWLLFGGLALRPTRRLLAAHLWAAKLALAPFRVSPGSSPAAGRKY